MNEQRIEALLERIALALERLVTYSNPHAGLVGGQMPQDATAESGAQTDTAREATSLPATATLKSFLESRGIRIKVIPPDDAADPIIDSLSLYLGERYHALSGLLAKIKRAMQSGKSITENLKDRSQQDINSICQFCTRLHEVAFLEQYKYLRSPKCVIKVQTTSLPRAQRFFAGQWLERFILQKVKAVYAQVAAEVNVPLPFEYLINSQIVLPNGDDFELDILAAFGATVYWIEAKSGAYQQHVAKYSKFARTLGLGRDHSLMVLTDLPEDRCDALSSLFSMSVCNVQSFEETLLAVARSDAAQLSAAADELSPAAGH